MESEMPPETLIGYLRAVPFRPFRVVLNSGRYYDVRHRDLLTVGVEDAVFFYKQTSDSPYDRWETFGLQLVEHIEHLETPATT
jgi:hypothetical protein